MMMTVKIAISVLQTSRVMCGSLWIPEPALQMVTFLCVSECLKLFSEVQEEVCYGLLKKLVS